MTHSFIARSPALACALPLAAMLAAGCAPATRVVLLPQENAASAVHVSTPANAVTLNAPYATADVGTGQAVRAGQTDAQAVEKRYGQLLAVQPPPPLHFTLYFQPGTSQLTPESMRELQEVLARATSRPGSDIVVTGHTDSVGAVDTNDRLSLQRASAVRQLILSRGFDPNHVEAVGRGEREPVVAVPDETDEPRNRRAEIVVR